MSAWAPATGKAGAMRWPLKGSLGCQAAGRSQKSFCGSMIRSWIWRVMSGLHFESVMALYTKLKQLCN